MLTDIQQFLIPNKQPKLTIWFVVILMAIFIPLNVLSLMGYLSIHPYVLMGIFMAIVIVWVIQLPLWAIYGTKNTSPETPDSPIGE